MLPIVRWGINRVENARALIEKQQPRTAGYAVAIIKAYVNLAELEKTLRELERHARDRESQRRPPMEQWDSIVYSVLHLLTSWQALIVRAEELVGRQLDVPRGILELRPYWDGESDPVKLYPPGVGTFASL